MNHALPGEGLAAPAANYALAIVSDAPSRLLHTSGIVPITPDGTVPASMADQADVVWSSILLLLTEADMTPADIVSITTYVVADHADELPVVMAARDRYLGGHRAASTLVTVPRLVRPEWLMEVAVVAAAG
ncbi:RidA family protein [Desertimonas flava]|uniref:RidA family protein n=1 Tax=Desertimonas flava TaxID=2064846 RepID=UPI001D0C33A8|nr:Rid family hydrolase [Desertimonas flava]